MEATAEVAPKESLENVVLESNNVQEKEQTPPQPPQDRPKKSKKDHAKKDDRNSQSNRSANPSSTPEERYSLLNKKYLETADENKKMQFYIKQNEKRCTLLLKDKEQLQYELNKTILVKSKLENLCRELQKQNKAIKEESLLKIREEEERRKEMQAKFQNTLSEITSLLQQNNEKNSKLRDDNISMSEKFKSVVQQYQLREQQVDKMAKQMALESQLSDAKIQRASLEHQAERERLIAEMEQMKMTLAQYRAKVTELQRTETALKGQLAVYTDKYDEFQNALVKSNQVFGGFKEQMETMSKKIKKLENESLSWKKRWETSQTALLDMCGERQASEEHAAGIARQLHHMQSLCRTLQGERTLLLNSLKEHNIERPPLPPPVVVPPPPPAPNNNAKVDAMVANCAQLRQSLAQLQGQLNVLTNNKTPPKEEPAKPEKQKKSKSKKNKAHGPKAEEKSELQKETERAESTPKDTTNVQNATTSSNTDQNIADDEFPSNKIDEKTVENLIKAINMANMNLCELEVENDMAEIENASAVAETTKADNVDETTKTENGEIDTSVIETIVSAEPVEEIKPNKDVSSQQEIKEVKEIAEIVNVVESSPNEEISHLDEVKPIVADA